MFLSDLMRILNMGRRSQSLILKTRIVLPFCVSQNRSAFAPDFKELNKNVVYEERSQHLILRTRIV